MSISNKQLLALKSKVEEAKNEILRLNGQQQMLKKQLKTTWACNTIEEANIKLKKMRKDIIAMETQIEEGKNELEEKYGEFIDG